ncbi:allophanate hydrolase-related protein [Corynebacterium glyciniphilum]|uniref:allophanate hydrolase-related protein n=1 Tax=Corynebacterium glyciniphilum TaxID=1404244 RepID=UPI00387EA040
MGRFLAGLPAPMALGQVTLSDGRQVAGFTCQPVAVEGAEDISAFGGGGRMCHKVSDVW